METAAAGVEAASDALSADDAGTTGSAEEDTGDDTSVSLLGVVASSLVSVAGLAKRPRRSDDSLSTTSSLGWSGRLLAPDEAEAGFEAGMMCLVVRECDSLGVLLTDN